MPLKPIKFKERIKADGITAGKAVKIAKITKTRWPKMEPLILQHPQTAYEYAMMVIKKRWPEAEPVILKNYTFANFYAKYIIKDRWPELEEMYKKHPNPASYMLYVNLMYSIGKGEGLI